MRSHETLTPRARGRHRQTLTSWGPRRISSPLLRELEGKTPARVSKTLKGRGQQSRSPRLGYKDLGQTQLLPQSTGAVPAGHLHYRSAPSRAPTCSLKDTF